MVRVTNLRYQYSSLPTCRLPSDLPETARWLAPHYPYDEYVTPCFPFLAVATFVTYTICFDALFSRLVENNLVLFLRSITVTHFDLEQKLSDLARFPNADTPTS